MVVRLPDPNARRSILTDVDFDGVKKKPSWITPVPGGAGSITETMLIKYAFSSAQQLAVLARGLGQWAGMRLWCMSIEGAWGMVCRQVLSALCSRQALLYQISPGKFHRNAGD